MNIVHELRKKKGIQQKELAQTIGVSIPTISNWENGKSDPSGERLSKLAEFFAVDELVILGKGKYAQASEHFISTDPKAAETSETDQIIQQLLERLDEIQPRTDEARILAKGVDKLSQAEREQALNVVRAMFTQYSDYFEERENNAP